MTEGYVEQGGTAATVTYRAKYADGSCFAGTTGTYVSAEITATEPETKITASWSDPFGNAVSGEITIIPAQNPDF